MSAEKETAANDVPGAFAARIDLLCDECEADRHTPHDLGGEG